MNLHWKTVRHVIPSFTAKSADTDSNENAPSPSIRSCCRDPSWPGTGRRERVPSRTSLRSELPPSGALPHQILPDCRRARTTQRALPSTTRPCGRIRRGRNLCSYSRWCQSQSA